MRAIVVADKNRAAIGTVETPAPSAGEIRVRVKAAALNRADLLVLAGRQHGSVGGAGAILGLECAGEVESLGQGATDFAIGDRVMCSARHAIAEYAVTDAGRATDIPAGRPTPELAPWTRTDSPFFRRPLVTSASCMVCRATGSAAASSKLRTIRVFACPTRAREADARTERSLYQRAGYEHDVERILCSKESWRGALRAMTLNLAAYVARRRTRPTWVLALFDVRTIGWPLLKCLVAPFGSVSV